jgi:hypothetical protein
MGEPEQLKCRTLPLDSMRILLKLLKKMQPSRLEPAKIAIM